VNILSSGSGDLIYRPIINLANKKLAWVKKLTDWERVSTEAFFEHLLQGIREQNAKDRLQCLPLALRIPTAVICQQGFVRRLLSEIHRLGIKPRRLMLLIHEEVLNNPALTHSILPKLHRLGGYAEY